MASSIVFRRMDEKHKATAEALKRRFQEATISGAVSRLLDTCEADQAELERLRKQLRELVTLVVSREQAMKREQAGKDEGRAIEQDLYSLARSLNKYPRQYRIDE